MNQVDPLTCNELVALVTDYFEGVLSPSERSRFDGHLDDCPGCVVYIDQMRRTVAALGHLPDENIPPEARETLLAAFRGWKAAGPAG